VQALAAKREELETLLQAGYPVVPIREGGKDCLVPYKRFASSPPTLAQLDQWLHREDWGDWGIGLPTGGKFAALDFDQENILGFDPMLFQTTVIKTPRPGYKAIYRTERAIPSVTFALSAGDVEVFGAAKYAILPHSKHPNGGVYEWVTPLEEMAPFPAEIEEMIAANAKVPAKSPAVDARIKTLSKIGTLIDHVGNTVKADCARQLMSRDLPNTERNEGLFTLSVLLKQNKMGQELVTEFIMAYYQHGISDKRGLSEREVQAIVKSAFGSRSGYKIGCKRVRQRHPWVQCDGCRWWRERTKRVKEAKMDEGSFLWRAFERFKGDSNGIAVATWLLMLGQWELFTMSLREFTDVTHLHRTAVTRVINEMQVSGLIRVEDKSQRLPF
jgi:hypothetical protein